MNSIKGSEVASLPSFSISLAVNPSCRRDGVRWRSSPRLRSTMTAMFRAAMAARSASVAWPWWAER